MRDELVRREELEAEIAELEQGAGWARRTAAAIVGSGAAALLAKHRPKHGPDASEAERRGVEMRRKRFRLARRKRVLEGGHGAPRGATMPEAASGEVGRAPSFLIRVAGRDWESARRGGDIRLALSLAAALRGRGHRADIQLTRADAPEGAEDRFDVILTVRGRHGGEPASGSLNLLWLISHPDEVDAAELSRYDRVLVASRRYARELAPTVDVPVEPLLQFTDPRLFEPRPDTGPAYDVLFVGNWRGEFRRIVWDAIQIGHPPALYGRGWDLLAPEHAVAEHVPHSDLAQLYSSCKVLLCDHWDDMRRHGFVSNRVFDALACETFVLCDANPALEEVLPGAVDIYADQADLREKLGRYLADHEERARMARRGREIVLARHTAERRAEELLEITATAAGDPGDSAQGLGGLGARANDGSAAAGTEPAADEASR